MSDLTKESCNQEDQTTEILKEEVAADDVQDGDALEAYNIGLTQDFIENDDARNINENKIKMDIDNSLSQPPEEPDVNSGSSLNHLDTTVEFLQIFQGKTEFNSWEEFHTLFEKFQKETGSAFKPRSVTSIEYANERRAKDLIPDHFVYQTVKMVCTHFGVPNPVRREGSKPRKKYVGLGCEAMVQLRYKGGTLNIVGCNLEHKNHSLFSGTEVIRSIRSFSFSDDIDLLMAKVVMEHNPFSNWTSDKEWMALVADLQSRDSRMKTVTVRIVKKRIRFLIDRYMSNSEGQAPLPDDEMGIILYELAKAKEEAMEKLAETQKRPGKKRGRPRKYPKPESDEEDVEVPAVAATPETYSSDTNVKYSSLSSSHLQTIAFFLQYLDRKNNNDRHLKQDDLDLRQGELELHRKQHELLRERFEFERQERQVRLDLLKAQVDMLSSQNQTQDSLEQKIYENGTDAAEYTIVLNDEQTFVTR